MPKSGNTIWLERGVWWWGWTTAVIAGVILFVIFFTASDTEIHKRVQGSATVLGAIVAATYLPGPISLMDPEGQMQRAGSRKSKEKSKELKMTLC